MKKVSEVEQLINEGKHFCIIPWVHLHVTGLGNMALCCEQDEGPHAKGYGDLNAQRFPELWQGEDIRNLRLKMLNDQADPRCVWCYNKEKFGYLTIRQRVNNNYKKHTDWVANTDDRGYAPDAKPVYWDIRFSNLCNLRCRTCCYDSSSSWYEDEKRLGILEPGVSQNRVKGVKDARRLLNDIEKYFPYLEQLYFAGGEPLIEKENLYILQKLSGYEKYNVNIMYNTNLTQLDLNNFLILDLWKKFKNIKLAASIDALAEKGEYIRKGSKWSHVVENIRRVKQECPHIDLVVHTAVSVFNILHLPDLHRELVGSGCIGADQIHLNLLQEPRYYNIKILPPAMKQAVADKFEKHMDWLMQQSPFKENKDSQHCRKQIMRWNACLNQLNSEDWTGYIQEFKTQTALLDQIRQENCTGVLPELAPLFAYGHFSVKPGY